jgi:hypothetical protein
LIYGDVYSGDPRWDLTGSASYPDLPSLIFACTNAPWSLIINQGNAGEQDFSFNVSITNLTTNILGTVVMQVPVLNATNVATNTPFQWSGPAGYASVFANTYKLPSFASYGSVSLPGNATNWPSPPFLNYGTNGITISYASNNTPYVSTTTPIKGGTTAIAGWSLTSDLQVLTEDPFTVGATGPAPVQLSGTPPQAGNGSFQLSFQTIPGRPEIVQYRTNLILGTWMTYTNFTGDGGNAQISLPTTNTGAYFRVITQ